MEESRKYSISSVAREVKREKWVLLLYSVVMKLAFILQDDEVYLFFRSVPSFLLSLRTIFHSYFKRELLVQLALSFDTSTADLSSAAL